MVHAWVKKGALYAAALGALNWGLGLFNINVLSYLPAGTLVTVVIGVIGVSGAYVGYETFKGHY